MTSSLTRRRFLRDSSCLLAGVAGASLLGRSAWAAGAKPSLMLSCGDATLSRIKAADCWTALKAIGAEGIEARLDDNLAFPLLNHSTKKYSAATPEDLATLKADLKAAGLKISAFLMSNKFAARPDKEVELTIKAAKAAQALGVPAIRLDVVAHGKDTSNFLQVATDALKKVIAGTESTGILFGVENHGRTTNDPEFLNKLFAGVGSKRLGLTLDTGNFYWFGHPLTKVYEAFARFAPRVYHTHCKSIKYPADQREVQRPMGWKYGQYACPIYEGDIDFPRVVKILRDAGYQGALNIEDESLGKRTPQECQAILTREIQHLKSCL